ncbi:hypothetical protein GCM10027052_03890 [Parafrigoribacterium mesophilum]|uniref:hypothetical protein n=1 Tax=Parafrigoribacterium mesophilum TaxID=433646 RepID=UPI0031FE3F85
MTVASETHGDFGTRSASTGFSGLDFSTLTAPVSRAEVRQLKAGAKGTPWAPTPPLLVVVVAVVLATLFGFFLVGVAVVFLRTGAGTFWATTVPAASIVPSLTFAIIAVALVALVWAVLPPQGKWSRWTRLDRFARANGLAFLPTGVPSYPGAIFGRGQARLATDHLVTSAGRYLDLGNYRYSTGSGDDRTVHQWGFLALKLDRVLPHIVLDASANNGIFGASTLPVSFDRAQVLSLEGDFDRYFTLYCPKDYERDALYVFTPDLLVLLIDESRHFDVEIVDDWLFVYSTARFDMTDADTLRRLFRIVDTVGAKTLRQSARYSDERSGGGTIAPAGRRLRPATPMALILVAVVALAVFAANAFGLLSTLFG